MGKMYSTLRNNVPGTRPQPVSFAPPAPAEDEGPEAVGGPDVPFIEIGPRRSVEPFAFDGRRLPGALMSELKRHRWDRTVDFIE